MDEATALRKKDQPGEKSEEVKQQGHEVEAETTPRPDRQSAPGRRPLFRN